MGLSILGIFILSLQLKGQFVVQPSLSKITYHRADSLRKTISQEETSSEKYAESDSLFRKAIRLFESEGDWKYWYKSLYRLRKNAMAQAKNKEFIDTLTNYQKRLPLNQKEILAKIILSKSVLSDKLGWHNQTIMYGRKFWEIRDSSFKNFEKYDIAVYENMGFAYVQLGDEESALKYYHKALSLLKSRANGNYYNLLYKLANAYMHLGNLEQAKVEFKKGLILPFPDFFHLGLVEVYSRQDSLGKMNFHLSVAKQTNNTIQVQVLESEYLLKMTDTVGAIKLQQNVVKELSNGRDVRDLVKQKVKLGILLSAFRKEEQAAQIAHSALTDFYPNLEKNDLFSNPNLSELEPEIWIIEALAIKANYFNQQYTVSKSEKSRKAIETLFSDLFEHFNRLKNSYVSRGAQYNMGAYSQKIYSDIIKFYVNEFQRTEDVKFFDKAFLSAQWSNSFVLKNAISKRKALEYANVVKDSIDKYLLLESRISNAFNEDENQIVAINEFDIFRNELIENYPNFARYEAKNEINLSDLQDKLSGDDLLLKYYFLDHQCIVFALSDTDQFILQISITDSFYRILNRYKSSITQFDMFSNSVEKLENDYLESSKELFDILLAPLLNHSKFRNKKHLILVPEGPLKQISFASLLTDESDSWSDSSNYLIHDYSIQYLYYCGQLNEKRKNRQNQKFVGFGIEYKDDFLEDVLKEFESLTTNEANNRSISLSNLTFADDEIKQISRFFDGKLYLNENATPNNAKSAIKNAKISHFSTHAFTNNEDFLKSFILLNRDSSDTYQLSYEDILKINLQNELVVLSACQTGIGNEILGEGMMSLARAFIQSGSKSAMGSYWNTPDKSTMILMNLFYGNLKQGMTKSVALRNAQLDYLTNDEFSTPAMRSPHYWASWGIYGANESVVGYEFNQKWIIYLLLMFLLFYVVRKII